MQATVHYQQIPYSVSFDKPIDISIPLRAGTANPNCYFAEAPRMETIRFGDTFVGSVALGGSCNYQKLSLTPHGNGTHTECYGHISDDGASIHGCLTRFVYFAALMSLAPQLQHNGDWLITLESLQQALSAHPKPEALIIRSLPNSDEKLQKHYSGSNPTYLEASIGNWLAEQGIEHLLVDLPSVDREEDGGRLAMHKNFWQYPHATRHTATITELIYVPNRVSDGIYLLHLQIFSLEADACPSKPVLYAVAPA